MKSVEVKEHMLPGQRKVYYPLDKQQREIWQDLSNGRKNISRKDFNQLKKLGVRFDIQSES